ncbi:MAG: minichromosome maintenance protein MCM [Candidatus Poseidoniia archaeon]|nr:minichromosome maintenance protein MCM [Candidatus Poseidoniia archaeon]
MSSDIPDGELVELWRSFFQDTRFRPIDSNGTRRPIPRCPSCEGGVLAPAVAAHSGEHKCPKCGGSGLNLEAVPTYGDQIESVAQAYPKGEKAVYVTWEDVTDFHPRLSNNLLWNLENTLKAARDVVKEFISDEAQEHVLKEHRTEISLDVAPLEIPDKLFQEEIRDLRKEHLYRMVKVRGLVRKSLPVRPRMEVGFFECSWERHPQHVIQDFFTLREPKKCVSEGCKCDEFQLREKKSQFIDSHKLEIQEFPEDLPPGAQPERLTVFVESSLAAQARPGDRIAVVGVLRTRAQYAMRMPRTEFDIFLYANSIDEREGEAEALEPTDEEMEQILELSRNLDLRDRITNSIAPSIFGMTWQKEAIAVQLFGGVDKKLPDGARIRGDIHVLMMGDPGVAKSQLLRAAARLAPRGVMATGKSSSAAGLTAAAVRDEFGEGRWTLEAGTLVLASGGLACIDEIDKMDEDDRSAMHEAMEQQTVTIAKAGISAQLHAKCSLLAAANPKRSRFEMTRPLAPQVNMPITLLSRFDIFFIISDVPDEERDNKLAERMLESHRAGEMMGSGKDTELEERELQPAIPHDLLRLYVGHARKMRPVMTTQAQHKLQDHYTAMRRSYQEHGEDDDRRVFPITPRQLESLIRLAEADARMHLSHTVESKHAERAIEMMTMFLTITLRGDTDFAETLLTKNQRQENEDPRSLIMQFVKKNAGTEGVDLNEILDHLESVLGLSHDRSEKYIKEMHEQGRIMEFRTGRWMKG